MSCKVICYSLYLENYVSLNITHFEKKSEKRARECGYFDTTLGERISEDAKDQYSVG